MQEIFKMTPHDKQVMMFSATLSKEIRPVCKKFMQDVITLIFYFLSCCLFNSLSYVGNMLFLCTFVNVKDTYF